MSKRFYWKKIRPILLAVVACCAMFLIIIAINSNRSGSLTIFVDRASVTKSLSLSESRSLSNPKGKIYAPSLDEAWDTTEDYLPRYVDLLDGSNNGANYIAYTFYLFNSGSETLDYTLNFKIENVSNHLDEAIRVRFYFNDVLTTYAKKNSISNEAETGTVAFESDKLIMSQTITDFAPEEVNKYSLVIWVEGDDIDCTNDKIGGSMTLSLAFSVLGIN